MDGMDGWMDGWMNGWVDGCVDGCVDGWIDGWTDEGQTFLLIQRQRCSGLTDHSCIRLSHKKFYTHPRITARFSFQVLSSPWNPTLH
jgi:hypothetical protein